MSPWSSGQDVALSRLNQGFDSPRRYQFKRADAGSSFFVSPCLGRRTRKGASVAETSGERFGSKRFEPTVPGGDERRLVCETGNSPRRYQFKRADTGSSFFVSLCLGRRTRKGASVAETSGERFGSERFEPTVPGGEPVSMFLFHLTAHAYHLQNSVTEKKIFVQFL